MPMNSSTVNSCSGDGSNQSDPFIDFPSVCRQSENIDHNNVNQSQNDLSNSRSVQFDGSTRSQASDTSRHSVKLVPPTSNQIKDSSPYQSNGSASSRISIHSQRSSKSVPSKTPNIDEWPPMSAPQTANEIDRYKSFAMTRRSSFDTISTKADSKVLSPYNIDTAGIRIGPPSESSGSYSESTDQSSHTSSSNSCTKQRVTPSNIPISSLAARSQKQLGESYLSLSKKKIEQSHTTTSITRSQHTNPKESDNLEGDFMGWGCGSESTYSDNNSKKSTRSNPDNTSVNLNSNAVVYEDFPERPRGDNLSVHSEPRSMRSIKVEDEFDSRRPWRKVPVGLTKEESTRSSTSSSAGSALSRVDGDRSNGSEAFGEVDQFRSAHVDMMTVDTREMDYSVSDSQSQSQSQSQSSYTSDGIQSSSTITELRVAKNALHHNRPDYHMQSLDYLSDSLSVRRKEPFRPGPPLPHSGSIDSRDLHRSDHSASSRSYRSSEVSCSSTQSLTRRDSETCSNQSISSSRGADDGSCSHQSGSREDSASCCSSRSENESIRDDDMVSQLSSEMALDARSTTSKSSEGDCVNTSSDGENKGFENARRHENKQNTPHASPLFLPSADSNPHDSTGELKSTNVTSITSPRQRNSALPQLDETQPYNAGKVNDKFTLQNDFENNGFADEIARARLSVHERHSLMVTRTASQCELDTEEQLTGGAHIEKKKLHFDKVRTYVIVILIVLVILAIVIYVMS